MRVAEAGEVTKDESATVVEETPPKVVEVKKPDINTATFSQLRGVGFSNSQTLATIHGRPYQKLEDLRNVPGINSKTYNILSKRICCVPVVAEEPEVVTVAEPVVKVEPEVVAVKKVNLNAASSREIRETLGCNKDYACRIVSYRNKQGRIADWEELKGIKYLPKYFYDRYKDQIYLGE